MLEDESTGQRGCTATGSGRNGKEAVAGAASEAFCRWLHHRQGLPMPTICPRRIASCGVHIVSPLDTLFVGLYKFTEFVEASRFHAFHAV